MDPFLSLLHFYFAFESATGKVERVLGCVKEAALAHQGASSVEASLVWLSAELNQDGPQEESALFKKHIADDQGPPVFLLNDFSRSLQQKWIHLNGRRFHVYKVRKDAGIKRGPRGGSEANLVSQQQKARNMLCKGGGSCNQLLGVPSHSLAQHRPSSGKNHSPAAAKVAALAAKRAVQRKQLARGGNRSLQVSNLRPGQIWSRKVADSSSASVVRRFRAAAQIRVVCRSRISAVPKHQKVNLTQWCNLQESFPRLRFADLVVLPKIDDLQRSLDHG